MLGALFFLFLWFCVSSEELIANCEGISLLHHAHYFRREMVIVSQSQ